MRNYLFGDFRQTGGVDAAGTGLVRRQSGVAFEKHRMTRGLIGPVAWHFGAIGGQDRKDYIF